VLSFFTTKTPTHSKGYGSLLSVLIGALVVRFFTTKTPISVPAQLRHSGRDIGIIKFFGDLRF